MVAMGNVSHKRSNGSAVKQGRVFLTLSPNILIRQFAEISHCPPTTIVLSGISKKYIISDSEGCNFIFILFPHNSRNNLVNIVFVFLKNIKLAGDFLNILLGFGVCTNIENAVTFLHASTPH